MFSPAYFNFSQKSNIARDEETVRFIFYSNNSASLHRYKKKGNVMDEH